MNTNIKRWAKLLSAFVLVAMFCVPLSADARTIFIKRPYNFQSTVTFASTSTYSADVTFSEDVTLAVSADDKVTFTLGYFTQLRIGTGATPDITLGPDDLFVEGTTEVDGEFQADGIIDANSTSDFADTATFSKGSGNSIVISSGGGWSVPAAMISAGDISDVLRVVNLPIFLWRTDADPPLAIVAGTTPNTGAEGNFDTIEWGTGEEANKITTSLTLPADLAGGITLNAYCMLDASAANTAETVGVDWYFAGDGDADNPSVIDEGVGTTIGTETFVRVNIPLDGATLASGDQFRIVFGFEAIDQTAHCSHFWAEYTSKQ